MKYPLETIRHSASHVMAAAVKNLYPNTKLGIGPIIEGGYYYDFDSSHIFTKAEFKKIESEMWKIKKNKITFTKTLKQIDEAVKYSKKLSEPYKEEIIKDLKTQGEKKVSFYKTGSFVDLCKGPHVKDSSEIGEFKLLSVAGAYWRGSEKNKMLQRIYGTSWNTRKELENYLEKRDHAKELDHRKFGKDLDLFMISAEVGQGLPIWLPAGATIRRELEDFVVNLERKYGYEHVYSPHIGHLDLYKTSGHWQHYKELMYPPIVIEKEQYLLRAMNCPHHIIIFKNKPKSYKDLPVRIAEQGTVYRYEKSGELTGLSRVRIFTINDAHIFCTREQISSEVHKVLRLTKYLYKAVGFSGYSVELALRDPKDKKKYVPGDTMWEDVEKSLTQAIDKSGEKYDTKIGEAAFYGPKIDIQAKDALGREFTVSTIQLDAYLPKRFKLEYSDSKGMKQVPFLIHRALIGSFERFVAFLVEHHAGKLPVWLSPTQIKVLPIAQRHNEYAESLVESLANSSLRSKANLENKTLSLKIREAELEKVPFILVVGDKERVKKTVSVRTRGSKNQETLRLDIFTKNILAEIDKEKNG